MTDQLSPEDAMRQIEEVFAEGDTLLAMVGMSWDRFEAELKREAARKAERVHAMVNDGPLPGMSKALWDDGLLEYLPSPASGVLLLDRRADRGDRIYVQCQRPAKPCRDATPITAEDAIDIARLASLRMWDSFDQVAELRKKGSAD